VPSRRLLLILSCAALTACANTGGGGTAGLPNKLVTASPPSVPVDAENQNVGSTGAGNAAVPIQVVPPVAPTVQTTATDSAAIQGANAFQANDPSSGGSAKPVDQKSTTRIDTQASQSQSLVGPTATPASTNAAADSSATNSAMPVTNSDSNGYGGFLSALIIIGGLVLLALLRKGEQSVRPATKISPGAPTSKAQWPNLVGQQRLRSGETTRVFAEVSVRGPGQQSNLGPPERIHFQYGPQRTLGTAELVWVPFDKPQQVGPIRIGVGGLYASDGDPKIPEPSSIDLKAKVANRPAGMELPLPYYPNYSAITAEQRRNYLEWLARGLVDDHPDLREHGYLFLYFYGLERRVFVDEELEDETFYRVTEFLVRYGSFGRSASLRTYLSRFLYFAAHAGGSMHFARRIAPVLELKNHVIDRASLDLALSNYAELDEPLPAQIVAAALAKKHDLSSPDLLRSFAEHLRTEFPEGIRPVLTGNKKFQIYTAANAHLLTLGGGKARPRWLTTEIDEAIIEPKLLTSLAASWASLTHQVASIHRAERRSTSTLPLGAAIRIAAVAKLPAPLQKKAFDRAAPEFRRLIAAAESDQDISFIAVTKFATFCGCGLARLRTQAGASDVVNLAAYFGYGIEPDPVVHSRGWGDTLLLAIFPLSSRVISTAHEARCAFVQMAAFVLRAGNCTEITNDKAIQEIVAPVRGTSEAICLLALAKLFERNPVKEIFRPTRVVANVPTEKRPAIAKALVRIAASDNYITTDEENALWTLFNAMDLPAADGRRLIQESGAQRESAGQPRSTVASSIQDSIVRLDPERVKQLEAETAEVGAILADAMREDQEKEIEEVHEKTSSIGVSEEVPTWLASLDPLFTAIAREIVERKQWPRAEFSALAQRHNQMPNAVIDGINLWADEAFGDVLLRGDDPVEVNLDLIRAA
jgi:TerB-C domain/TerB N-terminal domain